MAMSGAGMAQAILDALAAGGRLNGLNSAQLNALKADMTVAENARVDYIKANMEVKGVRVSTGTTLLNAPTPLVPVPMDGGAAVSAQMVANTANKELVQSNDGVGRVE